MHSLVEVITRDAVLNRVIVTVYLDLVYEVYRFECRLSSGTPVEDLMREEANYDKTYLPLFDGRIPLARLKWSAVPPFVFTDYTLYGFRYSPVRVRKGAGGYVLMYNNLWWNVYENMLRTYFRKSRETVIVKHDHNPNGKPAVYDAELWSPKREEEDI